MATNLPVATCATARSPCREPTLATPGAVSTTELVVGAADFRGDSGIRVGSAGLAGGAPRGRATVEHAGAQLGAAAGARQARLAVDVEALLVAAGTALDVAVVGQRRAAIVEAPGENRSQRVEKRRRLRPGHR